ncbi:low molecular weight phosphotyrosine protein phosphatase 1-like [Anthonomus grandis grandis]|uniref:low molecular weight phosphotyrosine protein phosphatase 1-like n=1 Tax=Anthonomus grandis grandis TaxID=2921223 RepID=UPI0021659309|nr:low molecular weight phosphotyrosine protein phosphatase 1-like [Anthonomus grandis grandis]
MTKSALFVCLGNICRSPIAEAVFGQVVKDRGVESEWKIDSAALGGWHVGNPPDSRASKILKNHGISYQGRARQIEDNDFKEFDYIFGMDNNNISNLREQQPKGSKAKVLLLGDFDPEGDKIIRDPYYDSGSEGFEKCYQQCMRACNGFLDQIKEKKI